MKSKKHLRLNLVRAATCLYLENTETLAFVFSDYLKLVLVKVHIMTTGSMGYTSTDGSQVW